MASRIGVGEGDNLTFRSFEGARLSAECQTAMSSGGEADTFDLGEGLDAECCVVLEGSRTGVGEMVGMRRPSVVVRPMTCVEVETEIRLSSVSASVKTGSGECVGEGGGSGLVMEGTKAASLGS